MNFATLEKNERTVIYEIKKLREKIISNGRHKVKFCPKSKFLPINQFKLEAEIVADKIGGNFNGL